MLWEAGRIVDGDMTNFVELTKSAVGAIEASFYENATPMSSFPRIVMHIADGGSAEVTQQWFTDFIKAGGQFDIVGLSYNPRYEGSLEQLAGNMKNLKLVFPEKDVWIVETSFYWTESPNDDLREVKFDQSQHGQSSNLKSLMDVLIDYGHDTAVFYDQSHWTQGSLWMNTCDTPPCSEEWTETAVRSLFDQNATALPAIDALVHKF